MSYSINTNIASLQAQEYLRQTSEFQSKTINRVTSGLRIVSSGDDAAGLAIANTFRSDRAVLSQGVRNANDGLSTLQTIDSGLNNISMLLDRARTLATQSASGTLTGSRSVLNSEFQSVIAEIDRQAQVIGLDAGGTFAKSLSVFIGGGREHGSISDITNGSVEVDLSTSTADARSLGLKGYQAVGVSGTDIGTGAASTSVQAIVNDTTNTASLATAGLTEFSFYGAGFSDANKVTISVSTTGITDTDTLVTAVNNAIATAGNGTTAAATAFKNAGIRASVNTDSDGQKQLAFSSSGDAFQVRAGDRMANALMGNYTSSSNPTGKSMNVTVTSGASAAAGTATWDASTTIRVRFQGAGMSSPVDLTLDAITGSSTTVATVIADLADKVASDATLAAAGISMTGATAGAALVFTNSKGEKFDVQVQGDVDNNLGFGAFVASGANYFEYSSITGSGALFTDTESQVVQFVVGNQAPQSITLTIDTDLATSLAAINASLIGNSVLRAAGLKADSNGGQLRFTSTNNTQFRISIADASSGADEWGLGAEGGTYAAATATTLGHDSTFNSGGAANTALGTNNDVFAWSQINLGGDDQTVTINANDSSGAAHSLSVVLQKDSTATTGRTLDEAINYINEQLQQSNDETLKKVVAVKEVDYANAAEGVRFLSSLASFKVSLGTNSAASGVTDAASGGAAQGVVVSSETSSGGSVADISNQSNAETAVTLLATAVTTLGAVQAVVGKGQNNFTYAVSLAQTQLNNLAASESRIRDADLATEAANLTKAQILQQAGIAALAQANVAPQAVLTLLKG